MSLASRFRRGRQPEPDCPGFYFDARSKSLKPCSNPESKEPALEWSAGATPPDRAQQVVTLVHGTFARHAPWMRDEGDLCKELNEELPNVRISRFCWSGANTHTARLEAGEHLAIHLRRLMDEMPDAKHFVAAHSHGGNVALYAMKDTVNGEAEMLGDRLAGIVTLATPFLAVRERPLPKIIHSSVVFTVVSAYVMLLFALTSSGRDWSNMVLLATLLGVWVALTAISAQMYRGGRFQFMRLLRLSLLKRDLKDRDAMLDAEVERLQPENTNLDKLLVVRPLGDEASMGLVVSQFFAYVQNRVLNGLQLTQDFLLAGFARKRKIVDERRDSPPIERSRLTGCLMGIAKTFTLIGLLVWMWAQGGAEIELIDGVHEVATTWISGVLGADESWVGFWLFVGVQMPIVALLAVYFLSSIASLIGLLGLLVAAIPFGVDAMFWNHFASTTAETSPPGTKPAQIFVAAGRTASGLAHSGIYVDKTAIRQIVEWILGRSRAGERGIPSSEV
jgi:pimeloyl-ACP methyl ester carboxylesterase